MTRLRRSIGIGAALSFLLLGAPADGAAAAQGDPPASAQDEQGTDHRVDVAELPARKRPATPAATPTPRSNARAGQVTCGQVITQNTVLRNDVGPCPGDGIVIGADNIFLNLNGHRVLGNNDQGRRGEFAGIRLPGRTGVTVTGHAGGQASAQMATVSGFEAGVVLDGGSGNTVRNLVARDNIGMDDPFNAELGDGIILFESASNLIIDNVIRNNGIFDGIGVLGGQAVGNIIQGNLVEDTVGPAPPPPRRGDTGPFIGGPAGQGIIINAAGMGDNLGRPITGSSVRDNIVRRNGSAGIANVNVADSEIVGNTVEGNGLTNSRGNGIGLQLAPTNTATDARVLIQGNEVHGNGESGIHIREGSTGNRILDNDAADNDVLRSRFQRSFDLFDGNPACDSNLWNGNVWGSGLYTPVCVTSGGSGPPAPTGPEVYRDPASCSDGFDNDEDGLADAHDPGCAQPVYEGANGRGCTNGLDDDGDGLIDSDDPGCQGPEGVPGDAACSDGIDNDEDGLIDGDDPDCQAAPVGEGAPGSRECSDGIDNDRDRLIDGDDPDCQAPVEGTPGSRECSDGIDNDRDRRIDGDDPDCQEPIQP